MRYSKMEQKTGGSRRVDVKDKDQVPATKRKSKKAKSKTAKGGNDAN